MNTNNIKKYAPTARREFMTAVSKRLNQLGIYATAIKEPTITGSLMQIDGNVFEAKQENARKRLIERAEQLGFAALVEQVAYTWFNRLCAIRFMELKTDYLEHGFRVLSHPEKASGFEILDHAQDAADTLGLNRDHIVELKLAGNKDEQLYRELLLGQCHQLHKVMPFLFEALDDETELLLPDNLTRTDSIVRGLVGNIPEADWEAVEVIGWLYQFYISEKKDQVIGKVVNSEDIPAATQLFTPNWIVKYLVQNSVGRQWLMTYPDSSLKSSMSYYIEPAEQDDTVKTALAALTPATLEPESIKVFDPACGSGHILVEAYDLLKAIYEERGYRSRDIPQLILQNNLFGLDIDDRAAQLAGFALIMKARADDRRIFARELRLNIHALQASEKLNLPELWRKLALNKAAQRGVTESLFEDAQTELTDAVDKTDFDRLQCVITLFEQAKTFGSLIQVPAELADFLHGLKNQLQTLSEQGDSLQKPAAAVLLPFVQQASLLAQRYDVVVANPPYMGGKGMNPALKAFAQQHFPDSKSDLFAMFMERGFALLTDNGYNAQVNMQSWMFLSSYQALREKLLNTHTIITMAHLGARAFGQISGEVVQTTAFVLAKNSIAHYRPTFFRLIEGNEEVKQLALLNKENAYKQIQQDDFKKITGSPIAYWLSEKIRTAFFKHPKLDEYADFKQGLATCNNDLFLRFWYEVSISKSLLYFDIDSISTKKWFPFIKGGANRKWYGNYDLIVNWESNGQAIHDYNNLPMNFNGAPLRAKKYYFREGLNWTSVSSGIFSVRYSIKGSIFGTGGSSGFAKGNDLLLLISFLNSNSCSKFLKSTSSTVNCEVGSISSLPFVYPKNQEKFNNSGMVLVKIARDDWNTYETSWDFQSNPLIVAWSDSVTQQNTPKNSIVPTLQRGNAAVDAPASYNAGALSDEFPRQSLGTIENPLIRQQQNTPSSTTQDAQEGLTVRPELVEGGTVKPLMVRSFDKLMTHHERLNLNTLEHCFNQWQTQNRATIIEMQRLEQQNNRLFIDAYGLQDELTANVPLQQITLTINPHYRYGGNLSDAELAQRFQSDTLAELISYAIGCMMGRYRLDKAGLIYAHAGNVDFDAIYNARINSLPLFAPDEDGIIPLSDQAWFKDDATLRIRDFVRTVWGEDSLQANLDFIAESLCLNAIKPKKSENSLDTIRRYLSSQFYKDHLRTYKKRPIYWLFSSGKQQAFECLVSVHRYNESTLSRMRTGYITPLLGKYGAFAEQLNKQLDDASTSEATRLKKELIALEKKQAELRLFDDQLNHYANMHIQLDLDDGVKVNYAKFGDLLAEVKAVTGSKE